MATINKQPNRFEITAVYRHPEAKADIVLVHGLNGAPGKTWLAPNGVFWPTDLLPAALYDQHTKVHQHANILTYGYNADVFSGFWERQPKNPSDNFIHHHAQTLVTTLTAYRKSEGTERLPIIWVVHSLGGILTKRALLYSNDLRDPHQEDLRSIYVSTYGIIFLGTPHGGADAAAWGTIVERMADALVPKRFITTESVLLKTLKKDSETLQQITNHFLDIYQRFKIHMVHENHKTSARGMGQFLVVDAVSASPQLPGVTYYGVEATHSGMCKFESDRAPGWLTISTAIRDWIADAPNVIPIRWEVEEDQRRVRANLDNFERARLYNAGHHLVGQGNSALLGTSGSVSTPLLPAPTSGTPPVSNTPHTPKALPPVPDPPPAPPPDQEPDREPLFIHPEKFRPNSYFIGREDELRGLHEMLMDRKRRSEGTSAVLIQCLPGGGKTHLARQYVFQHKDDYPGGVYWVRAKSRHELEYWFWRIARNEALRGLVDRRDVEELRDPRKIVQIVRRWLSSQSEWLMVFDGVQFDIPGLHEFIPDARNTSMIYTSTERAVTGDPRFDNPQVMELGSLTLQEATDLLLLEMERKKPWSAEDQAMAAELVGLMGRLPLMIHVAAQHLKATREPLARYLKSYRTRPKAGDLPAYKAVREQLENRGETAALNLMSLLVFFDQHVPVEMVMLGLSALDKTTPVRTCDATHRKASLNNTLKVLIAFALLERSESDDISPTSSRSSRRSFDRQADYLDLLRIHSVVQAFFIETLQEKRELPFWLERAVHVWARSYDEADRRIREDPRVGLPDDYRRFAIHGEKLLQHLDRFQRRHPKLAGARALVEERLGKIRGRIEELSQAVQKHIVDGSAEEHPASVFDRLSTSSQSDAATIQSHDSSRLPSRVNSLRHPGGEFVQSPMALEIPDRELLPWNTPYPETPAMPPTPGILLDGYDASSAVSVAADDDDQNTLVLSIPDTQIHIGDSTEIVSLSPDPSDRRPGTSSSGGPSSYFDDWQTGIPSHRVIRRQETRRYHDRAGAWRDKTISDPRVGLSRDVAVGSVVGTSTGINRRETAPGPRPGPVAAQSEAAVQLHKIKLAAPPSPKLGEGGEGSSQHAFSSSGRPMTLVGRNSWAVPQAVKTPVTDVAEVPPEAFSSGLAQILSSPKSWTAATIRMLKKTVLPSDKKAGEKTNPARPQSQGQLSNHSHNQVPTTAATQDGSEVVSPPTPLFRGSRSANSSPANHASPFPPPSFAGIPTDDLDLLLPGARPGVPVVARRWETHVYHPDGTPMTSSGVVEWTTAGGAGGGAHAPYPHTNPDDRLSLSYPSLLPSAQQQQQHQQLVIRGGPPGGYSSQPMSRDGSHRSSSGGGPSPATHLPAMHNYHPQHHHQQQGQGQYHGSAPVVIQSPPTRCSSPVRHDATTTTTNPPNGGNVSSGSLPIPTPALPIRFTSGTTPSPGPVGVHSFILTHPPSYTETEPSPRLDPAFPDVDTSYHRWELHHQHQRHLRQQAHSPYQPQNQHHPYSSPYPPTGRPVPMPSGTSGTPATAGSRIGLGLHHPTPRHNDQGLVVHDLTGVGIGIGMAGAGGSEPPLPYVTVAPEGDDGGGDAPATGGEAMSRSASAPGKSSSGVVAAGIRMDDGTVVGFGAAATPPPSVAAGGGVGSAALGTTGLGIAVGNGNGNGNGGLSGAASPRGLRRGRAGSFPGTGGGRSRFGG
ncbi:hypothetical protein VTJ49DRAFT_5215 [Mycothermus thermophilus]|uniref:DUF676 domain-containing protein n=1 Tax=Humicola insolens TaxID=85995 RepID=A0ABR3V3V8_HUMIN